MFETSAASIIQTRKGFVNLNKRSNKLSRPRPHIINFPPPPLELNHTRYDLSKLVPCLPRKLQAVARG
jgi:hypothetical protein